MVSGRRLLTANLDIGQNRSFFIFMFIIIFFLQDGLDDSTVILSDENRKVSFLNNYADT